MLGQPSWRSSRETPTHDGAREVTAAPGKSRDSEIPPSRLALSLDCQNAPSGLKQDRMIEAHRSPSHPAQDEPVDLARPLQVQEVACIRNDHHP